MSNIEIELIPKTSWYINLRSYLSPDGWQRVRKFCLKRAGNKCEVCGKNDYLLECHEVWEYDENRRTQSLVGVMVLCDMCHKVKHAGHASSSGSFFTVARHLAKVNGITYQEAVKQIRDAFALWKWRSEKKWSVEMDSWLEYFLEAEKSQE